MITREDAVRLADEWFGGKNAESGTHIGVREFDLGFVVWAIDDPPEDLSTPPPAPGSAAGVIDKTTGKLTMMPGLPPEVIISRYRARVRSPGERHPEGEAGPMITREQAEHIASGIIGGREAWELVEFSDGWLLIPASAKDHSRRGAALTVIERSGRVMQFPSYVPADRIINEYTDVAADGYPVTRPEP